MDLTQVSQLELTRGFPLQDPTLAKAPLPIDLRTILIEKHLETGEQLLISGPCNTYNVLGHSFYKLVQKLLFPKKWPTAGTLKSALQWDNAFQRNFQYLASTYDNWRFDKLRRFLQDICVDNGIYNMDELIALDPTDSVDAKLISSMIDDAVKECEGSYTSEQVASAITYSVERYKRERKKRDHWINAFVEPTLELEA